jgi:predicted ribosome quality control (RQC) complex YloA/Tae2 family protein
LPAPGLTETACDHLAAALHALLTAAAAPGPGYLATPPKARPVAYPVPLPPTWEELGTLDSLSAACSVLHRRLQDAQVSGQLRQRLTSCLEAARTRAQRCEDARAATLAEAAGAEIWRHRGDLLLANLNALTPQATEVTVDDWETGEPVTLALDPALSPTANAQRHFARYKKLQRVLDQVPPLLAEARAEREDYEDLLDQVAEAGVEELRLLEEELRQRDLLPAAKRARQPVKVDYRRAQTSEGYAVLYGRSSLENAAVLKAASPDDLWFHVQGTPGGHVVLRTNNRPGEVPQTALLEAARLAARQSLRRREAVVAVDYTLIKRLTHIRGAGPGHVVYRDCQTLMVKPRD